MPGVISRLLGAPRALEIRTAEDLAAHLRGSGRTWSGIDVTPDNALHVSAFFDGVRVIAEDIGKLPFIVYRRRGESRERATGTPEWRLVHDEPKPGMSSQLLREALTAHALMRGNGYALKNPPGLRPRELLLLDPRSVRIERLEDHETVYHVSLDGKQETLTRRHVFHLPGFSLNGYSGVSVVTLARQGLALAMATERHGATLFGNGAHPGGLYKHPGTLSDQAYERLVESLKHDYTGDLAHSPLLLEEGLDWARVGLSPEDSQFLQTRKFQVTEVARWLRLPPHKLADLERSTFSNIEQQSLEYVTDTLMSWARRWEYATNLNLLGPGDLYAEILFDGLLRGDAVSRNQAYRIAAGGPYMTRNEVRRRENLNPLPDPEMDAVITPQNVTVGGGAEGPEQRDTEAQR